MFREIIVSGFLALALACGPAMAQTETSAPPPGAAMGSNSSNKELIASCRAEARAKGLKGDALKSAVDGCVGAQKPEVAARMRCRQQGRAQGIAAGDALKAFVKNCVAQGKQ